MGQVSTALISGVVALVVAGGSAMLALAQIRGERRKWLADIKATWSLELYKTRMQTFSSLTGSPVPLRGSLPAGSACRVTHGGPA